MPRLIYPTSLEISGPVILSRDALRELDELVRTQVARLRKQEQSPAGKLAGCKTSVVVLFANGSRIVGSSFDDIEAHLEAAQNVPSGFSLTVESGLVTATVESDEIYHNLKVEVTPSTSEAATIFYSAMRQWAQRMKPPFWQKWWLTIVISPWIVWILWIGLAGFTWVGVANSSGNEYYKEQARQLVEKGITTDNQLKALQTLLAIQSDYSTTQQHLGRWFWFFLFGGSLVMLVLSYPPKIVIGLGRGEKRVILWQKWLKFVFVVVPSFVASNILWPIVSEAIKRLGK